MTTKKPIAVYAGQLKELQPGDILSSTDAPGAPSYPGALTAPTLFLIGDSQVADGWQPGTSLGYTFNYRIPMWVRSGLRYRMSADFNSTIYATSGYTTANWIATHMANCVAAIEATVANGSTPIVVMKLGTNDCGTNSLTYAQVVTNFETIFTALSAAGAIVFPVLILPRSGSSVLSTNMEKLRNGLNRYLVSLGYRSDRRIIPINSQPIMCNNAGVQNVGYFGSDGLHPTSTGARAEGLYIASVLSNFCPADIFQLTSSASDTYDATYNPLGNRLQGFIAGTTGTKDNSQVTGNIATGYHAGVYTDGNSANHTTAGSHMTAVGSIVNSNIINGLPCQEFVLGGTANTTQEYLAFYASNYPQGTNLVEGDVVEMGCWIEWDDGLTNVCALMNNIGLWFQGNAGEGLPAGDETIAFPSEAGSMLLVTNPITIPAGYSNTNIQHNVLLIMACPNTNAIAGKVRIGAPFIKKKL